MLRLDQDRQNTLEPIRMTSTKQVLENLGFKVTVFGKTRLEFIYKGSIVMFYPYSGWFTGKAVKDGRGFNKLLTQLICTSISAI